jgi:hypothetical protein
MFSLTKNVSRWGAVALSTVVVGTLAGCGSSGSGGGEPTQLSDGDVTISMAYWGGDTRVQQTDAAIAAFEKQHPNITVQAEPADWTGYWDGLATRTAAGDMPSSTSPRTPIAGLSPTSARLRSIRATSTPMRSLRASSTARFTG